MELSSRFDEFISAIQLTDKQRDECIAAHQEVREKVASDPNLSKVVVATFLQGSYARHTIIKPSNGDRSDVDVVVVTKLSKDEYTPAQAIGQFRAFLEKNYKDRYQIQGRSIGIKFPALDLDLVVTAAPSESVIGIMRSKEAQENQEIGFLLDELRKGIQWKEEPLLIPDRDAGEWVRTFPLRQIEWTREKNKATNGHFINVVKVVKRWRDLDGEGKRPKGFLIERLVGKHCPDGIQSVAEGVEAVLRGIKDTYGSNASDGTVPMVPDMGIISNNVFKRLSVPEFRDFYGKARVASAIATDAYKDPDQISCSSKWCSMFGKDFRSDSGAGKSINPGVIAAFRAPTKPAEVRPGRFA